MRNSRISWCDDSFNYWFGCTKVSPGCDDCWAADFGKRIKVAWGPHAGRRLAAESRRRDPHRWNAAAERAGEVRFVFGPSMGDMFDNRVPPEWRAAFWRLMRDTPWNTWLVLTKRPQNARRMLPADWGEGYPNVWLGVTAENQEEAERRLPLLLALPARTRFVSVEPQLERVSLARFLGRGRVEWVICGCEAVRGRAGRPFDLDWARLLRDECAPAGVAFWFKQMIGADGRKVETPELDGRRWTERPEPWSPLDGQPLLPGLAA